MPMTLVFLFVFYICKVVVPATPQPVRSATLYPLGRTAVFSVFRTGRPGRGRTVGLAFPYKIVNKEPP